MRILTNMRFWQSRAWTEAVDSIYPGHRLPMGRSPLSPPREALELCRRSRRYDIVVTMGARETLSYGLLCALRRRPSKQIACEVFTDDAAPANPLWRLKQNIYRLVMKRAIGLLTNSTAEIDACARRFGITRERIRYVPLHTNIMAPELSLQDDGFALSAGATRRDYATLIEAARMVSFPITIVCSEQQSMPPTLPSHVQVRRNIPRDEYIRLVRRSSFVVVPLLPTERATGQVVILEAMACGKAVIATEATGTIDLVRNGVNGLLIPPFDAAALAGAIQQLAKNTERRRQMGHAAFDLVLREHTIEHHAARKLAAIAELFHSYGEGPGPAATR
jgi:glycosyltransferase involved in cell wall biosynthesis